MGDVLLAKMSTVALVLFPVFVSNSFLKKTLNDFAENHTAAV